MAVSQDISSDDSVYLYNPSHILPIVFAILIGISLVLHIYQNFHYRFWRITFFMFWGNVVFTTGWILRAVSTYKKSYLPLFIAQTIFIYAGPPIYAAAEYNILGRLMHYVPMHAILNPSRVIWVFVYIGCLVESLTGAGAGRLSAKPPGTAVFKSGGTLIAVSVVLQAGVECVYVSFVATIHRRAAKAGNLSRNLKLVCLTLYGTSTLVLIRCVFRAVEAFSLYTRTCDGGFCTGSVAKHEWFLYVFEAAPMVVYTWWLNWMHPGRFLPREHKRYLDLDGRTERMGPGWIDNRSAWMTFVDPFNFMKDKKASTQETKFWLRPADWKVCENGSFAEGTASNAKGKGANRRQDKAVERDAAALENGLAK